MRSQSAVFSTLCFVGLCCALQASTVQEAIHLEGVVIGRDRAPLAAVHIILSAVESAAGTQPLAREPAPEPVAAVSDERGVFRLRALRAGRYRLLCESEGYEPYRGEPFAIDEKSHPDIVILLVSSRAPGEGERGDLLDRLRRRREANPPPGAPEQQTPPASAVAPSAAAAAGLPLPDRWRIGLPGWDRYPGRGIRDNPYRRRSLLNPYGQNILKGDIPIIGQNTFLSLAAASDSIVESRRLPTSSGQSGVRADPREFFGQGRQNAASGNLLLSFDLFHGNAGFRPVDWRVKLTAGLNLNYVAARERGVVGIDVRAGTDRTDEHIGVQEAFGEIKLADIGPRYDFLSLRAGVQGFLSDFRGFVFADSQPGARLFGSLAANRIQWNAAWFDLLEKDTNSGLNTTRSRHQTVAVANLYCQDFLFPGYTLEGSFHVNDDRAGSRDPDGGFHYDENGFLVRPAAVGDFTPHDLEVRYYGLAGEGHIGRLNLTHALYLARGRDDHNPIAGRPLRVEAEMAAADASFDFDWLRLRASIFYASGDGDPQDGVAKGFDSILDDPGFAGGAVSFWNRQGLRLSGTNLALKGRFSFLPDLRSSKEEGQANFVNPGLFLYSAGADAALTPKVKLTANLGYLRFDRTEVLDVLLFQEGIRKPLGIDASAGVAYRPWLNENVVVAAGAAVFRPSSGFRDVYERGTLYSVFSALTLLY